MPRRAALIAAFVALAAFAAMPTYAWGDASVQPSGKVRQ
jgi:hypothetical protein